MFSQPLVPVLRSDQVRELDRRAVAEYGLPALVLMENAGRGAVDLLCRLGIAGPVAIACGSGNNGGDGLVMARHLDLRGHAVEVLLAVPPELLRGDPLLHYQVLVCSGIPCRHLAAAATWAAALDGAAWVVDALLGTGARGAPRPPLTTAIDAINAAGRPVLAVDLPSGLDADSGAASPHTIRAAHTATFVAAKPGLVAQGASPYVGQLHLLDIGAPRRLVDDLLAGR